MTIWVVMLAIVLGMILLGIIRVLAGPTAADRLLAAQLFGTIGVAALCLDAAVAADPRILDVALIFAFLAAVTAAAFAYFLGAGRGREP